MPETRQRETCGYCQAAVTGPADFRKHIRTCEKHPLNKLVRIVAKLVKYAPNPMEYDIGPEYMESYNAAAQFVHSMGIQV